MRAILPSWTDPDPGLHARLADVIDPERKVLAALERIVPLSGKRIADVGAGIGDYPLLLARRTGRTYGIEADAGLRDVARERAEAAHQPNIRIVEGEGEHLPLRDGAVDILLSGEIGPASLAARRRRGDARLRPGGRRVVIGYYGRDDMAGLLEPEVVERARQATQRRIGWWLKHHFKIKVVHTRVELHDEAAAMELLPLSTATAARLPEQPHPVP